MCTSPLNRHTCNTCRHTYTQLLRIAGNHFQILSSFRCTDHVSFQFFLPSLTNTRWRTEKVFFLFLLYPFYCLYWVPLSGAPQVISLIVFFIRELQHENSMPCSMNLSQLSSLKLASSSALLIASAIISSLRDLADMVEALHHMMSLISQSVSTAQFRGSDQYQYFSQDVQYLERTGTVTFDVCLMPTCFSCFLR